MMHGNAIFGPNPENHNALVLGPLCVRLGKPAEKKQKNSRPWIGTGFKESHAPENPNFFSLVCGFLADDAT